MSIFNKTKYASKSGSFKRSTGDCEVCGQSVTFEKLNVIDNELARQWEIDNSLKEAYSVRESMICPNCGCSARLRSLAYALTLLYDKSSSSFSNIIDKGVYSDMQVAEINACGKLHNFLAKLPNLAYSEYESDDKNIRTEDLQALSYADESFDLVLDSDTLEHVPDFKLALKEIHRVLKPNGYHVFTVPMILSRKTRRRVSLEGEGAEVLEESYHGSGEPGNLVATEFGRDFIDCLDEVGFSTQLYFATPLSKKEVNYVLVSKKVYPKSRQD